MNLLEAALKYTEAGLAAIPLWRDRRKNPKLTSYSEFYSRLPTRDEWTRWAHLWPGANIGLITGYWRNLAALDFDSFDAYRVWCEGVGFDLKGKTWTVRTKRGCHVWFEVSCDPGESRNYTRNGHEVLLRARGGYCIVPPSVHHTGFRYRTVHKAPPLGVDSTDHFLHGWEPKQAKKPSKTIKHIDLYQTQVRIEELIPIPERSRPNARGAYQVYCPFHDDGKPSAWLNPSEQRFGCNACWPGLWFDASNVYAKIKGISNRDAYKEIRKVSNEHH